MNIHGKLALAERTKDTAPLIVQPTPLPGLLRIIPKRFGDHRGFFSECYNARDLADHGVTSQFVQDNHSVSEGSGTLRGLHFQGPPHAQDKLVRCGRGALFDVAVDIRRGSPTVGHWFGAVLSAENGVQMLVPAGFAHGFLTLQPETEILYKCSDYYAPECEGALRWDDPDIGIEWPLSGDPIVSEKDATAPALATLDSPFLWDPAP